MLGFMASRKTWEGTCYCGFRMVEDGLSNVLFDVCMVDLHTRARLVAFGEP